MRRTHLNECGAQRFTRPGAAADTVTYLQPVSPCARRNAARLPTSRRQPSCFTAEISLHPPRDTANFSPEKASISAGFAEELLAMYRGEGIAVLSRKRPALLEVLLVAGGAMRGCRSVNGPARHLSPCIAGRRARSSEAAQADSFSTSSIVGSISRENSPRQVGTMRTSGHFCSSRRRRRMSRLSRLSLTGGRPS